MLLSEMIPLSEVARELGITEFDVRRGAQMLKLPMARVGGVLFVRNRLCEAERRPSPDDDGLPPTLRSADLAELAHATHLSPR